MLGRPPHQGQEPRLDMGQQGILLRLVEAMDLIDEKHRRSTMVVQFGLGLVDGLPDVLHPGQHGRDGDESAVGRTGGQAP